jgi:hypothetical protein
MRMRFLLQRIHDGLRLLLSPRVRVAAAVAGAVATMTIAAGGCSSGASSTTPTPTPSSIASATATPTGATPTPVPQNFISISATAPATTDPTYGVVAGYGVLAAMPTASPLSTAAPSQIITVSANQTIVFVNFDKGMGHTASLLGPANGMNWPLTFTNTNGTSSLPAGTAITYPEFSTGTLAVACGLFICSQTYSTGATTGMFYFGDFFGYLSNPPIRTVIIIQ